MNLSTVQTTAARHLAAKLPVTTALSAAEIADYVPQALRDTSVFSARTVYAEHVAATQADIVKSLDGTLGAAEIRARMKLRLAKLGYQPDPDKRGGLQDLSSDRRTNLVISMQESAARGYAVWRSHQDPALMTVWPAQELYRALSRKVPRDWQRRWNDARRALGEGNTSASYAATQAGPFVALKNDPIWTRPEVNRFGHPWTPFDYESGMRLRNIKASAARSMGVLQGKAYPKPQRDPMRQPQSASAQGVPQGVLDAWVSQYQGRAVVSEGRVWVAPDASVIGEVLAAAASGARATAVFGFASARLLANVSSFFGALPAHTGLRLSADAVASGAVEAERAASLPAILMTPSVVKEGAAGTLTLTTRGSVTALRHDADAAALDVVALGPHPEAAP